MARIANLWVYPVKGLDRMSVEEIRINDAGTFQGDRAYALVDPEERSRIEDRTDSVEKTFNGKEIDDLHSFESAFDPETETLTLRIDETSETSRFDLSTDRDEASDWFSEFVGEAVELRERGPPSFIDRPKLGPSVISTGTLEEVASWFDSMSVEGARRRFRPNIEISGVPPFWEDQFLRENPSGFDVGRTRFEGAEACARCVVPSRDPDTGRETENFSARFSERREQTLPEWVDEDAFEHFFTVMLITSVPERSRGTTVRVGDEVSANQDLETA
ncbi:MOSC domain-containing protein [Natrarchaeobius halalkaliphilus]|uniref:MOSC domain-containing protein n=1 Tax=Natrarchaeobius halalkaliphilus TaxID=1679091 RepID=A0A3N6MWB8_9EURY|nr:MOSC N-terminal beta barrel domain-containing protein [Natrarchaeobius halalkaliphilus]RQG89772.1 MOSC domain-containing protein [Natrarchaeobius halalkaliphilus]